MPHNENFDRIQTVLDEKNRAIYLSEMQRAIPPNVGIFDEPTRCFKFNLEWCKLVVGWLLWMADVAFWQDAQDESYSAIRQMLVALEGEPCSGSELPDTGCIEYKPYASFITYSPQNPFTDPDGIPIGYAAQPFVIAGVNYPAIFHEYGDVVVQHTVFNFVASWFNLIAGNLPVIRAKVSGIGTVELHFVTQAFGGRVGITIDRPLNVVEMFIDGILDTGAIFIDLNQDFTSFPGESVAEIVKELEFDTDTEHEIHITFVPVLNDELLLPVTFGGALRSIHLCGVTPVSQGENIVNDIRINNCVIEVLKEGVWVPVGSIEDCIVASPTIAGLKQADINLQNQINFNDSDIMTLQQTDVILQNQITGNDNDIAGIQNTINQITTIDLPQINQSIGNHESRIDTLELNIAQNNGIISNHEQRIIVLENAPSGGGGGQLIKTTAFGFETVSNQDVSNTVFTPILSVDHVFTYPNALIHIECRLSNTGSSQTARLRVRLETTVAPIQDIAIGDNEAWAKGTSQISTELNQVFEGVPVGDVRITLDLASTAVTTARLWGGQIVQFSIIEYSDFCIPSLDTVTFDCDSLAYTIPSDMQNVAIVGAGGNPDDCLQGAGLLNGEWIAFSHDFGSVVSVGNIEFDWLCGNTTAIEIRIDGNVVISDASPLQSLWDGSWHSVDLLAFYGGSYPSIVGQVIEVRLLETFTTGISPKLDNIKFTT